jgi:hypothetical protein
LRFSLHEAQNVFSPWTIFTISQTRPLGIARQHFAQKRKPFAFVVLAFTSPPR